MKTLKLALLITCALMLNATATATATLTKPDASGTVHESECPCLLCWWCEPEEPHEPPPHEEPHRPPPHEPPPHEEPHRPPPHEPPPHEEPHRPPPREEPHDHPVPEIPELPPIPKFCPPSEEEPGITHYPPLGPPPPHEYVYQPNPIIAATSDTSDSTRNYMAGPLVLVAWGLVAGYLFN